MTPRTPSLTRTDVQQAVADHGWRLVLADLLTTVAVPDLDAAGAFVAALGTVPDGDRVEVDVRAGLLRLRLPGAEEGRPTRRDLDVAAAVTALARDHGLDTDASAAAAGVQATEIAVDAIDIPAVLPFWRAVLGYVEEPWGDGEQPLALVDPRGQGPAYWFQQMDAPRPQRNRIHVDVTVAHDEAESRVAAALAAGGTLLSDAMAPAFWVLADAEGNEACVCTWQGRDEWDGAGAPPPTT